MKKAILFSLLLIVSVHMTGQNGRKIVILHTNDLHSRLTGFAPESQYSPLVTGNDNTVGGFARIASILKTEKQQNEGLTLIIDGGDFLMGTLFHTLEATTGFQLRLMKSMGYDIVCLGNHEFDFGPGKLASMISSSVSTGPVPFVLLGNAVFSDSDPGDDALEKHYSSGNINRKLLIEKEGLKLGFFSLFGKDADEVAPSAKPVKFAKMTSSAKKMVRELKAEGCDLIICLSHSGLSYSEKKGWYGEDADLARKVKGIDLIISGHTHTQLNEPLFVNGVPIIQSGEYGKYVGRLEATWTGKGMKMDDYRLIPVDDAVPGDRVTDQLIEEQKQKVSEQILLPLGLTYDSRVAETEFMLECNEQGDFAASNLGPMVADAIHYYINGHTVAGTDISMVAVGVIRDRIMPGVQTVPDIFRVMSLGSGKDNIPGYPLSRLYVTGRELKSILEILQVAYKSAPSNYCYYSGLRVLYDPAKGLLRKIKKIEIINRDGTSRDVDFSKRNTTLYSVTANSYMLEFIGIIKKMSFGLINVVPKDAAGAAINDMKASVIDIDEKLTGIQEGKEWLALLEYLASMKDTNDNTIPDIDKKYSSAISSFTLLTP